MGLQHAIEELPDRPGTAAGESERETSERSALGSARLGKRLCGIVSGAMRFAGRDRTGPRSVWKMAALAILTYVVAVNLSYFLVLKPVWTRLNALVEKKAIIEDFLVVRESTAAVASFKDNLMRGDERVTVIGELEAMAADAGLKIVGEPVLPDSRELSKKMTEYPIELTLKGSYHAVGEFLSQLESGPRPLLVRKVELDVRESAPSAGLVKLVVGAVSWEE